MKKYINYFWGLAFTSTAKSTYITTFGAGLVAFLGFVFWIIIARSMSPSDFGLFSVVFNLVNILYVICDVGLSSSLLRYLPQAIREAREGEVKKILKVAFLVVFLASGLLAFALILFAKPLAVLVFTKKELSLPLALSSFSLLGISLSYLFITMLQGKQKFLLAVIIESSMMVVKVSSVILLVVLGRLNLVSLLFVFSLTSFSGLVLGLIFIRPSFLFSQLDGRLFKILFGFGVWVALARVANAASARIDTLMLTRFVDSAQIGFYSAAQRMTFIFPVLVTGMTAVISPKFAALKTKQEGVVFFKKATILLSLLFVPLIILFILAPWVTIWIYGDIYESSVSIFRWLLVSSAFFIASSVPILGVLYFLGESKFFAIISLVQLSLIFLGNLILIPRFGVIGPPISLAISYGVIFFLSLFVFIKKTNEKE